MMSDQEYFEACGLPEELCGLWAAEYHPGPDGEEGVFHVETLATILQTNDRHVGRGWHAGYVPFALCRTAEAAHAACDRMQRKQEVLRDIDRRSEPHEARERVLGACRDFHRGRSAKRKCHKRIVRS